MKPRRGTDLIPARGREINIRASKREERKRERESQRAGEIVSSRRVKYTEDVGGGFNIGDACGERIRRRGNNLDDIRDITPDGRSGSASGTNKSSRGSHLRRVVSET